MSWETTCQECGADQAPDGHRLCTECLEAVGDACCEKKGRAVA